MDRVAGTVAGTAPPTTTQESWQQAVERVIAEVRSNLAEPWTNRAMADIANYSMFHFNRVFTSVVGLPPRRFLAALRLDEAKRLLLTTDLSVTRICYEVGYESLGTFTTRFTELVGVSPRALRRNGADRNGNGAAARAATVPELPAPREGRGVIAGVVDGADFGPIYVGLFPERIPQGPPLGCAVLDGSRTFRIERVAAGRYFVMAYAPEPAPGDPGAPDMAPALVGSSSDAIIVDPDYPVPLIEVQLRPLTAMDPPVVVALDAALRARGATAEDALLAAGAATTH